MAPSKANNMFSGSGGQKTFVIKAGTTTTITNFGGVGPGVNPSKAVLAEVDTLKLQGTELTVQSMCLTQQGDDLLITFPFVFINDEAGNTQVILKDFNLEDLDNLQTSTGASVTIGNILSNGERTIQDNFDVINATQQNLSPVFNPNAVTFLNDLDNTAQGLGNYSYNAIHGQGGNDQLYGGDYIDTLFGGAGDDILDGGGDSRDIASYTDATAKVTVNLSTGTASGGAGNDILSNLEGVYGSKFNDTLIGNAGSNDLYGGAGNDIINGLAGNDGLVGGTGNDTLNGGVGNNFLNGGAGNDVLNGGPDGSEFNAGEGDDILNGGVSRDFLGSGGGNDTLNGYGGNDSLIGNEGNDILNGGSGNDSLYGDEGNDILNGGSGNDQIQGGVGNDTLNGGSGNDLFVLAREEGTDTVVDYKDGSDHLGLMGLTFGELTISQSNSNTLIQITDTNEVLASLTGVKANLITAADFTTI